MKSTWTSSMGPEPIPRGKITSPAWGKLHTYPSPGEEVSVAACSLRAAVRCIPPPPVPQPSAEWTWRFTDTSQLGWGAVETRDTCNHVGEGGRESLKSSLLYNSPTSKRHTELPVFMLSDPLKYIQLQKTNVNFSQKQYNLNQWFLTLVIP